MRLSIGILAWNEEASIGKTIESLFRQTLFTVRDRRVESIEVICVPNGCTDNTSTVAQEALRRCRAKLDLPQLRCRVQQIREADKANAWNRYVHEFSDQSADYVFLMDADVTTREQDGLHRLLAALDERPDGWVAVPRLIKDIALRTSRNPWHRLSMWTFSPNRYRAPLMSGALYCGRGEILRRMWMPVGLLSEDAFLRELIVTDGLRGAENLERIVRAGDASVVYGLPGSVSQIVHRNRRMAMGGMMNLLLFRELAANGKANGICELIRRRNRESREWALTSARDQARACGISIARHFVAGCIRGRTRALRRGGVFQRLVRSLVVAGRLSLDLLVAWMAYGSLARGRFRGAW